MSDIEKSSSEQAIAKESQQENARQERIAMFGVDILDPVNWTTYQSNKIVKSIPMTRELYNRYRDFPQVEGENPNDEGYLIEYTDGGKSNHPHHENYISWSPKDVFDRNHSLPVKKGRGLTPDIALIDEAGWYCDNKDFARLTYMKDLGNGTALGTVEILSGKNGELSFGDALKAIEVGYRVCRSGWNGKGMWITVSNPETATVNAENFWNQHNRNHATAQGGTAKVPPCFTMRDALGQIQMGWLPSQPDCFAKDWYIIDLENNEGTIDGESQEISKD